VVVAAVIMSNILKLLMEIMPNYPTLVAPLCSRTHNTHLCNPTLLSVSFPWTQIKYLYIIPKKMRKF
jgi:hypothetical protein